MVKIVKNPGNGHLNNLNDLVLSVLTFDTKSVNIFCDVMFLSIGYKQSTLYDYEICHELGS